MARFEPFGDQHKFCEPSWYQGKAPLTFCSGVVVWAGAFTPYYTASHAEFRKRVRDFVMKEIDPYAESWLEKGG